MSEISAGSSERFTLSLSFPRPQPTHGSTINESNKLLSPWSYVDGYKWRLMVFPSGNGVDNSNFVSAYVECGGPVGLAQSSQGDGLSWRRRASISLQLLPNGALKETSHSFRSHMNDWGFLELEPITSITEDTAVVQANVEIFSVAASESNFSEPPEQVPRFNGRIGLKSIGQTSYLNVLLQMWYNVEALREAVYQLPIPEAPSPETGLYPISFGLQKVFYDMDTSAKAVDTRFLTSTFGWEERDLRTAWDVCKLMALLSDELLSSTSPSVRALKDLLQGTRSDCEEFSKDTYISRKQVAFRFLSLEVRGCQNIISSFEKYVEARSTHMNVPYRRRGIREEQELRSRRIFQKLPPILQLHLKRFSYDQMRERMVKLTHYYEFTEELDLSRFVENSDGTDIYVLHAVIVQGGKRIPGSYQIYIRCDDSEFRNGWRNNRGWLHFDNEEVSDVHRRDVLSQHFGFGGKFDPRRQGGESDDSGDDSSSSDGSFDSRRRWRTYNSTAYVLLYLRQSQIETLLKPRDDIAIPEELVSRIAALSPPTESNAD